MFHGYMRVAEMEMGDAFIKQQPGIPGLGMLDGCEGFEGRVVSSDQQQRRRRFQRLPNRILILVLRGYRRCVEQQRHAGQTDSAKGSPIELSISQRI